MQNVNKHKPQKCCVGLWSDAMQKAMSKVYISKNYGKIDIIGGTDTHHLTIRFRNTGAIRENINLSSLKKDVVADPSLKHVFKSKSAKETWQEIIKNTAKGYEGTTWNTTKCGKIKIIKYESRIKVLVQFLNSGNKRYARMGAIKLGNVQDKEVAKLTPNVYGIGYYGIGKYTKHNNPKVYDAWRGMLRRCYDPKSLKRNPCYQGCWVCDEWHNFQKFAAWWKKHCHCEDGQIDKDILFKGNRIYSPETCCIVPFEVNNVFFKKRRNHGEWPIGVTVDKRCDYSHSYKATFSDKRHRKKRGGVFKTPELAFGAYKKEREQVIHNLGYEFKNVIEPEVFQALINYKIDITD